jgi:hypothetical protein
MGVHHHLNVDKKIFTEYFLEFKGVYSKSVILKNNIFPSTNNVIMISFD